MKASKIVGKKIARVVQSRCPEEYERYGERTEHDVDAIVFTDGSVLRFNVCEHDGDYGVKVIYPGREVE